jgi:hypothetical protein
MDLDEADDTANLLFQDGDDENEADDDDNFENLDVLLPRRHQEDLVDPLGAALDGLENRIVTLLDELKLIQTSKMEDLQELFRPLVELGAHVGPQTARTHARSRASVDQAVREVYERLNTNLLLPVVLEISQTDVLPAKRAAALQFFHMLHKVGTVSFQAGAIGCCMRKRMATRFDFLKISYHVIGHHCAHAIFFRFCSIHSHPLHFYRLYLTYLISIRKGMSKSRKLSRSFPGKPCRPHGRWIRSGRCSGCDICGCPRRWCFDHRSNVATTRAYQTSSRSGTYTSLDGGMYAQYFCRGYLFQ